jgi:hypothetical protein
MPLQDIKKGGLISKVCYSKGEETKAENLGIHESRMEEKRRCSDVSRGAMLAYSPLLLAALTEN